MPPTGQLPGVLTQRGKGMAVRCQKRNILLPISQKQVREFLGTAGFCRLWIPGLLSWQSLYILSPKISSPLHGLRKKQRAFDAIQAALMSAPGLGLPDVTKLFHLYGGKQGHSKRGCPDSKIGTMEETSDIPLKKIRSCGLWVLHLSEDRGRGHGVG